MSKALNIKQFANLLCCRSLVWTPASLVGDCLRSSPAGVDPLDRTFSKWLGLTCPPTAPDPMAPYPPCALPPPLPGAVECFTIAGSLGRPPCSRDTGFGGSHTRMSLMSEPRKMMYSYTSSRGATGLSVGLSSVPNDRTENKRH